MSKYNKTILTNKGLELAKKANSGKAKFQITRALTSSEDLSGKTIIELQELTDLPSPMQTGTILDAEPTQTDNAILGVSLRFTNKDLTNSYPIRAVGLYVKEEGQDHDFLYALATAQEAEFMPDYSDQVLYRFNLQMYVVVGRVQSVTVEVLDGTSVPYEAFNRHIKESNTRFENLETTRAKSATINGGEKILPDNEGNLPLTVPDPDLSNLATKEELKGYGKVKSATVNGGEKVLPDEEGNLPLTVPDPDLSSYGKVKTATVNGGTKVQPDAEGNLALTVPDPDLSSLATKEELKGYGKVKTATVNGGTKVQPDAAGNLALTVPDPDLSSYGKVKTATVNGGTKVSPDAAGNLALTIPIQEDNHIFLTEKAYDSLTDSQKNNGKIYMIEKN